MTQFSPLSIRLMALLALLTFAGCGGGDAPDADSGQDSSAEDAESDSTTSSTQESDPTESPEMAMDDAMEAPGEEEGADDGEFAAGGGGREAMEAAYEESMENPYEEYGNGRPQRPARPEKIAEWTPQQVAEAIFDGDEKSLEAIDLFAKNSKKNVEDLNQLKAWVSAITTAPETEGAEGAEGGSGGGYPGSEDYGEMQNGEYGEMNGEYGRPGGRSNGPAPVKHRIAQKLLQTIAANGTSESVEQIKAFLHGQVDLGVPYSTSMEWVMTLLMTNENLPSDVRQDMLWTALTTDIVVEQPQSDQQPQNRNQRSPAEDKSPRELAQSLHLGYLVAAMSRLIGSQGPGSSKGNSGGYGEFEDYGSAFDNEYGGPEMENRGGPNRGGQQAGPPATPIEIPFVSLSADQVESALNYLWSDKIVDYVSQALAEDPQSTEALVMAAAIPTAKTRSAISEIISAQKDSPPTKWLQQKLFEEQFTDPAIHFLVKSFPREQRPQSANGGGSDEYGEYPGADGPEGAGGPPQRRARPGRASTKKKEEPTEEDLAKQEARFGWMDASEQTLVALMDRMYDGSLHAQATPADMTALPFQLHKGAEVTNSMQFTLPIAGGSPALQSAAPTVVNYIRIESTSLNQKTVTHYKTAVRDEQVVAILNGNGMWLDAPVKANKATGIQQSVDVLLSRNNVRPTRKSGAQGGQQGNPGGGYPGGSNPGGGNGGKFVVEVLVIALPGSENAPSAVEVSSNTN